MSNIIHFKPTIKVIAKTEVCQICKGKGVEGMRIGRMYSEITCRACKGSGDIKVK